MLVIDLLPDCRGCVSLTSDFAGTRNERKVVLLPE